MDARLQLARKAITETTHGARTRPQPKQQIRQYQGNRKDLERLAALIFGHLYMHISPRSRPRCWKDFKKRGTLVIPTNADVSICFINL